MSTVERMQDMIEDIKIACGSRWVVTIKQLLVNNIKSYFRNRELFYDIEYFIYKMKLTSGVAQKYLILGLEYQLRYCIFSRIHRRNSSSHR